MRVESLLEAVAIATIIYSTIVTVNAKNPVRALLFLIITFLTTALIFLYLELEFLGFIIILVYVGAVLILFLFAAMTLNTKKKYSDLNSNHYLPLAGLFFGIFFVAEASYQIADFAGSETKTARQLQIKNLSATENFWHEPDFYATYGSFFEHPLFFLVNDFNDERVFYSDELILDNEPAWLAFTSYNEWPYGFELQQFEQWWPDSTVIWFPIHSQYKGANDDWYSAISTGSSSDVEALGFLLYSQYYMVPMLLVGLILLVALIGVVYLTKKFKLPTTQAAIEFSPKAPRIMLAIHNEQKLLTSRKK